MASRCRCNDIIGNRLCTFHGGSPLKPEAILWEIRQLDGPEARRKFGRSANDDQRSELAAALEQARERKQQAAPKSEAWYDADSDITVICDVLYSGRTIDPLTTLYDASLGEEA